MEKRQIVRIILNIFLVVGMLISLFLLYEHFAPSASKYCTFGNNFDCSIVNRSPYANLDGVSYLLTIDYKMPLPLINISGINSFLNFITSNAFLGFLTLLFLLGLNASYKKPRFFWVWKERNVKWIQGILIFSVIYAGYLFYIQYSILQTYCIFCIGLDVMILLSLITSFFIHDEKNTS